MPWLQTDAGRLYYQIDEPQVPWASSDQPIVFCHGVGTNCDTWSPWLATLREHYRVVRFDTRGFGRSSDAADGVQWSLERLADDILAVVREAGAERFHLVGESLGGTVCLYLATRGDADLASLTLASTAYRGDRIGAVRGWWDEIESRGMRQWSRHMMQQRFVDEALTSEAWTWFEDVQQQTVSSSLLGAAQLLLDTNLTEQLGQVKAPTFIINSDASPYVTPALAVELHSQLDGAELCVIPNSRHGVVFSHGEQCAEMLLDFIARRVD